MYKLQKQSQEIMDVVGPNLEKMVDEPLLIKISIQLQNIVATKATISVAISEWRTFQDQLLLTSLVVVSTCQENYLGPSDAIDP